MRIKNKKTFFSVIILIFILLLTIVYWFRISKDEHIGMLTVVTDCSIPEGCGPKYKLWDSEKENYIPLLGDIKDSDSNLIIKIKGVKTILPKSEYNDMNYSGPITAIKVISYEAISKIPYFEFLKNKAGEFSLSNYPCLARNEDGIIFTSWNKKFTWEVQDNEPILKVRMTNTFSDAKPQPFYELWYDGNTGKFIKEVKEPNKNFCKD